MTYTRLSVYNLLPANCLISSDYNGLNTQLARTAQPNLKDFKGWLREFAITCENLPAYLHPANTSNISTTYDVRPRQPRRKQKFSCPFDNQEHHPAQCSLYKEPTAEDMKLMNDHNRCLTCLGHHMVKDCNSKNTCGDCIKKHHTTIQGMLFK